MFLSIFSVVRRNVAISIVLGLSLCFNALFAHAKEVQTISAKEYEKLEKVQTFIDEKNYPEAKKIIDGMR